MSELPKIKIINHLSAWRKGDLIRMPNRKEFRLTSEPYEIEGRRGIYCDTDRGKPISYLKLIGKAFLIETGSGRKNELLENKELDVVDSFSESKKNLFEAFSHYAFSTISNQPYNEDELLEQFNEWYDKKFSNK